MCFRIRLINFSSLLRQTLHARHASLPRFSLKTYTCLHLVVRNICEKLAILLKSCVVSMFLLLFLFVIPPIFLQTNPLVWPSTFLTVAIPFYSPLLPYFSVVLLANASLRIIIQVMFYPFSLQLSPSGQPKSSASFSQGTSPSVQAVSGPSCSSPGECQGYSFPQYMV